MNMPQTNNELRERQEENLLSLFLRGLNNDVFVKSTNSVTGKEEELDPVILDMEAIIKISGEWDREDLKKILLSLSVQRDTQLVEEIEKIEPHREKTGYQWKNGYNQAIDEILELIRTKIK
jgi:hypothetical protein